MPRLQIFAACEKVIISQDENLPTLIALLDGFTVQIPRGESPPPETIIPVTMTWFSHWKRQPGDEAKAFEQRIRVRRPNGDYGKEWISPFDFLPPKSGHRISFRVNGFPLEAGEYVLELSAREIGESSWRDFAEYSVSISHEPVEPGLGVPPGGGALPVN